MTPITRATTPKARMTLGFLFLGAAEAGEFCSIKLPNFGKEMMSDISDDAEKGKGDKGRANPKPDHYVEKGILALEFIRKKVHKIKLLQFEPESFRAEESTSSTVRHAGGGASCYIRA